MAAISVNLVPNADGKLIYNTGETIHGSLMMVLKKETKCKDLFVSLTGKAKVKFEGTFTKSPADYVEKYLEDKIICFHNEYAMNMPPGFYKYEFVYNLPKQLPRSYPQKIKYKIQGVMNSKYSVKWESKKLDFYVARYDNLNLFPMLRSPQTRQLIEEFYSFGLPWVSMGVFRIIASLPFGGFALGETIKVWLKYENCSSVDIKFVCVDLRETILMRCEGLDLTAKSSETIVEKIVEGVDAKSTKEVTCELTIPTNISQSDFLYSNAFTLRHSLRVLVKPTGLHLDAKFIIPIVIGAKQLSPDSEHKQQSVPDNDSLIMRKHLAMEKF